jgi:hypothetical protein
MRGKRTSLTEVADSRGERRWRALIWSVTVVLIIWGFVG